MSAQRNFLSPLPGINKRFTNFDAELYKEGYESEGGLSLFNDALQEDPDGYKEDAIFCNHPPCPPPTAAQNPEPMSMTMPMTDTRVDGMTVAIIKSELKKGGSQFLDQRVL